jgi:hypothetical protein
VKIRLLKDIVLQKPAGTEFHPRLATIDVDDEQGAAMIEAGTAEPAGRARKIRGAVEIETADSTPEPEVRG